MRMSLTRLSLVMYPSILLFSLRTMSVSPTLQIARRTLRSFLDIIPSGMTISGDNHCSSGIRNPGLVPAGGSAPPSIGKFK